MIPLKNGPLTFGAPLLTANRDIHVEILSNYIQTHVSNYSYVYSLNLCIPLKDGPLTFGTPLLTANRDIPSNSSFSTSSGMSSICFLPPACLFLFIFL